MTASLEVRPVQDSETPATPVFAAPIRHPSAWTVADFRSPADYTIDLDAAQLRDIAAAMRRIKAAGIGLDGLQREHFEVLSLSPVVEEILQQIKNGRGFVLLRGLPIEDYSKDDLGLIFWGIGTHLGRGLSQSVLGDRLGHVRDFSREDPGARAYRNKQELSPHTDSCDLVGLLCLRNAQAGGGVSRLTSAISVHNTLLAEQPDVLAALYRGYVRHRRGEEQPGELPYTPYRIPVYSNVEGKVSARYVRSYIEADEAAAGRPMGPAERAVIDTFEAVTKRPELMLEFTLQPGEAYFINNYTILHARTAFDDGDAAEDASSLVAAVARRANPARASPYPWPRHPAGSRPNAIFRLEQHLRGSKISPVLAETEELGVLIFIHPQGTSELSTSGRLKGTGVLDNVIGNPLETTIALSHLRHYRAAAAE